MPDPSNARQATSDHQEGLPRLACHCDAGYRKWIYFARSLKRRQNGRNHTTTWPSRPREAGQLGGHVVRSPWPAGLATAYALVCRRSVYVTHNHNSPGQ